MQLGPDARTGAEGQQTNRLAAAAQSHHKQPGAAVLAALGIAHHGAGTVIDLRLLAGSGDDHHAGFGGLDSAPFAHEALHTLVAAGETVSEATLTNIQHEWLQKMVAHRIADPLILRLIGKWLKAGYMLGGVVTRTEEGSPQGGPVTPLTQKVISSSNGQLRDGEPGTLWLIYVFVLLRACPTASFAALKIGPSLRFIAQAADAGRVIRRFFRDG